MNAHRTKLRKRLLAHTRGLFQRFYDLPSGTEPESLVTECVQTARRLRRHATVSSRVSDFDFLAQAGYPVRWDDAPETKTT